MSAQSFVTLDDNTKIVYVEQQGSGRPVLFVPGWTFTSKAFEHQIEHLKGRHRVIAIDPRGQGDSGKPAAGNTYQQHGKDIAQVIAKLGLQKPVLVGWSNGCLANYAYVQQYGTGNLGGFVCIDAPAHPKGPWALGPADALDGMVANMSKPEEFEKFLKGFSTGMVAGSNVPQAAVEAEMASANKAAALSLLADWKESNYTEQAKAIGAAVPFLYVIDNKMYEGKWFDAAKAWIETVGVKAVLKPLAGGHMGFRTQPDAFNKTLDAFLAPIR